MTTCNQIYAMPFTLATWAAAKLAGRVLESADMFDLDYEKFEAQTTLQCCIHGEYDANDGRRFAILSSLWFDGKPFAVIESAGREGDDHVRVVVTDLEVKYKAEYFVQTNCRREVRGSRQPTTPADEDLENLGIFYGQDFVSPR